MRELTIAGLEVRAAGGDDGDGGGDGAAVVLLHGFGAPGDDLVSLAGQLDVPPGTRFFFPEGPISLVDAAPGDRSSQTCHRGLFER